MELGYTNAQLRHLLWATSKHDVYITNEACIMHWSTLTQTQTKVGDHSGLPWPAQAEPAAIQRRRGMLNPSNMSL